MPWLGLRQLARSALSAHTPCDKSQEIERRAAAGQQVNPFLVAMDLIATTAEDRVRLHAAEFLGDRLLPKLKAVEHGGEVGHNVMVIHHRYGRSRE